MNTRKRRRSSGARGGLGTDDTFVSAVPWSDTRTVLVHRRVHGWREYVRFRTWNRHHEKGVWYPSRRFFIIPIANASALGDALYDALGEFPSAKPDWLIAREQAEEEQLARMVECGATEEVVERARLELDRDRRRRI